MTHLAVVFFGNDSSPDEVGPDPKIFMRATLFSTGRRGTEKISLKVKENLTLTISPGGQNELVRMIVEEFGPRFAPGGEVLYVGDAAEKWEYFDQESAADLGIDVDKHGKMPDVVIYDQLPLFDI